MMRTWGNWLVIEIAVMLAACSPGGTSSSAPYVDAQDKIKEADEFGRRGDYESAMRAYIAAVAADPKEERVGRISRYGGDMTQLQGNENDIEIARRKRFIAVENEALTGYLSRHPNDWQAVVMLANNYVFLGRAPEAVKLVSDCAVALPGNSWPHAWLAKEYTRTKKFSEAVEEIRRAGAIQTAEYEPLVDAGQTAYNLGKAIPKKNRKLRLAAAKAGETALRRAVKIVSPWPTMSTLAGVLWQRAAVEPDSETAQDLYAEAQGYAEAAKQRRQEDAAEDVAREIRNGRR